DEYGYHRGDAVIQWLAQLLTEHFSVDHHFVGHVGGDDFIVVSKTETVPDTLLATLKSCFQTEIISFYKQQHVEDNYMLGRARNGRYQKFPLLDYCVAIVEVPERCSLSHQEIAGIA